MDAVVAAAEDGARRGVAAFVKSFFPDLGHADAIDGGGSEDAQLMTSDRSIEGVRLVAIKSSRTRPRYALLQKASESAPAATNVLDLGWAEALGELLGGNARFSAFSNGNLPNLDALPPTLGGSGDGDADVAAVKEATETAKAGAGAGGKQEL